MAKICEICGRGPMSSNTRSHSNIATKSRQHINLQQTTHLGKRIKICARCLRTMAKQEKQ